MRLNGEKEAGKAGQAPGEEIVTRMQAGIRPDDAHVTMHKATPRPSANAAGGQGKVKE